MSHVLCERHIPYSFSFDPIALKSTEQILCRLRCLLLDELQLRCTRTMRHARGSDCQSVVYYKNVVSLLCALLPANVTHEDGTGHTRVFTTVCAAINSAELVCTAGVIPGERDPHCRFVCAESVPLTGGRLSPLDDCDPASHAPC